MRFRGSSTIVVLGLVALVSLHACGNKQPAEKAPQQQAAAKYTCSMHPEVSATAPGKCPQCCMDLVPVEASPTGSDSAQGGKPHS